MQFIPANIIRSPPHGMKAVSRVPKSSTRLDLNNVSNKAKPRLIGIRNMEMKSGIETAQNVKRKGIGVAMVMQGTAIPYLDMGGASIKMNDDGSFNLLVGATDLGTGSDTVLAQMAAEVLGVPLDDIICYSSDTDFTPFDKGAYASSTTYISGAATVKAAQMAAERIKIRAAKMLDVEDHETIQLANKTAIAPNGKSVSLAEIALDTLHKNDQEQIMGIGSYVSPSSPPPFAAQFAEVTVDTETGAVKVDKLVMAVDSGVIVNPLTASGQIEGGMTQALGLRRLRRDAL